MRRPQQDLLALSSEEPVEPIARNIIQMLQRQGLVSQRDLVDGSSVLFMGRQRNRFFVYKQLHGPSFFIKQAHEDEAGTVESVKLEAQIYKAVADNAEFQHLQAVMPQLLHFDQDSATMTLLLIKDAEDLGTCARRLGQNSCDDAGRMGQIAAQYHTLPRSAVDALDVDFPAKPHWIFRLEEAPSPLPSLRGRSPASAALIDALRANPRIKRTLQWSHDKRVSEALLNEEFGGDNLAVGWRKPSDGNGDTAAEVIPGSVLSPVSSSGSRFDGLSAEPSLLFNIYPAPSFDGKVNISSSEDAIVSIIGIDGVEFFHDRIKGNTTISVELSSGFYLAFFTNKGEQYARKIIVR